MSDKRKEASGRQRGRSDRVQTLKKMIIAALITAILIPLLLCVFLLIKVKDLEDELSTLQETRNAVFEIEESTIAGVKKAQNVSGTDIIEEPETQPLESPSLTFDIGTYEEHSNNEETDTKKVYLTFDDGPSSNTNDILNILDEYGVKATFFVVGKEGIENEKLYKRIVEDGHTVGMHSYSHKYSEIYESLDAYKADLSKLQEYIYGITGVWSRFVRFPGGSSNKVSKVPMKNLIQYLDEEDITYFDWNISSGDASSGFISADTIVNNCTSKLDEYHEAIILMHDASGKNATVDALPKVIETIQAMDNVEILPITDDTFPIQHIAED